MADCRALVMLTSEESKRLIAKGIAGLPIIQKARERGIIGLCICSSARYVAEELLREPLPNYSNPTAITVEMVERMDKKSAQERQI